MNPALLGILGALVRWLLTIVGTFLVSKGILTQDEASGYMLELTGVVIALLVAGWAMWVPYIKQKLVNTSLAMPSGSTMNEAKQVIASGAAPPASVQADHAPFLKGQVNPGLHDGNRKV